jgi:hypothetical protein
VDARKVLERLCTLWGASSYKELAQILEIGESTPSSWAKTGNIPFKLCIDTAEKYGCSLDDLVFGKKPQTVNEEILEVAVYKGLGDACELRLIPELDNKIAGAVAILTIKAYKEEAKKGEEN